jgi:hypothetical protein
MSSMCDDESDYFFSSLNKYIRNRSKHSINSAHSILSNHALTFFNGKNQRKLSGYSACNMLQRLNNKHYSIDSTHLPSPRKKQNYILVTDQNLSNAALLRLYSSNTGN